MSPNIKHADKNLQGIDSVTVRVSDIYVASDWYQSKLGFIPIWEEPKKKLIVMNAGSACSIKLWQSEPDEVVLNNTNSYIIFNTKDAISTREELIQKGVKVEELIVADFVRYFFFYDPDGNVLEACQVLEF